MNDETRWRDAAIIAVASALSAGLYSVVVGASAAECARVMFVAYVVAFLAALMARR